jgi:hypothetical protein
LSGSIRFGIAGLAALVALTVAGNAMAKTYQPSLLLSPAKHALGAKTGIGIGLDGGECCFAPGRITVYSPPGYGVKLEHPVGAHIGSSFVSLMVREAEHRGIAHIRVEDPLEHAGSSCAPGRHDAVWMFEFNAAPYRFSVPMYVDRVTSGPEAAYASAQMVMCFASPYVPPPQGAPAGIALAGIVFGVRDVFTNPSTPGTYPWNAVLVPYMPGTATLSSELSAQSTSYVRLPVALELTVRRLKRGGRLFSVTACLRENGEVVRGVRIQIFGRPGARRQLTRFGQGRTDARGCFTRRVRLANKVIFGLVLTEPLARNAPACSATLAPHCSRPTIGSYYFQRAFRLRR